MSELARSCTVSSASFNDNMLIEIQYIIRRSFKLESIGIDADLDISSEIIQFFSIRENISREQIILLPFRTSCEQTDPMLRLLRAATIPVLNYHKPLTPARTKLFLHSDPNQPDPSLQ